MNEINCSDYKINSTPVYCQVIIFANLHHLYLMCKTLEPKERMGLFLGGYIKTT